MPVECQSVLGIDAAWTDHNPSGVALLRQDGVAWECLRVAPSYESFCTGVDWSAPVRGGTIDVARLLAGCRDLLGGSQPTVITVDMPLALAPITSRREADRIVSRQFGHRKCAVHSPGSKRPGATGRRLHEGFADAGYALATASSRGLPALVEVYPHVALLGLTGREERLPYKVAKGNTYWPGQSPDARKRGLVEEWKGITASLQRQMAQVAIPLPARVEDFTFSYLKRIEDAIDALVCAWVGAQWLQGSAAALGDDWAAIWVPTTSMAFAKDHHAS